MDFNKRQVSVCNIRGVSWEGLRATAPGSLKGRQKKEEKGKGKKRKRKEKKRKRKRKRKEGTKIEKIER